MQHLYRSSLLLFPLLSLLLLAACDQLGGDNLTTPGSGETASSPTGSFGVSGDYGGPYLSDAEGSISDASDERVVSARSGGKFYVQADYEDPDGITGIEVNLVNESPENLAGTLDPTQSFFTLGQPTDISEPTSDCDLSNSPTSVTCVFEVRVAEDAVNITELEGAEGEFAYAFSAEVTDAASNTSESARGYVSVAGDDGGDEEVGARAMVVAADELSNMLGTAAFSEAEAGGVLMELNVASNDVISGGLHAIHVHENGSCEVADTDNDGVLEPAGAAGGHYNPTDVGHGEDNGPHVGDSERYNYSFNEDGSAALEVRFPLASLEGENPFLKPGGTALIIHAGVDDKETDPGGKAGSRIACGVLEKAE